MARLSNTSSAISSNGHPPAPANAEGIPERRPVPESTRQVTDGDFDFDNPEYAIRTAPLAYDPSLLPTGSRSLSLIGLQSFFLGFALATCSASAAWLAIEEKPIWRLSAFFACLSLFHFLEYWTTARFNLPAVRASSFLLFSNGTAYNVAHTLAAIEIIVSSVYLPWYQALFVSAWSVAGGLFLVTVGQGVRSIAMAQAGTNFNHTPAKIKKEGHELVTTGVYSWLRHPSYFGFFWWALGTQVLVGNKVCFIGYLFSLWNFFNRRIIGMLRMHPHSIAEHLLTPLIAEERTLVDFFGKDYEAFRQRTGTGIPFIR